MSLLILRVRVGVGLLIEQKAFYKTLTLYNSSVYAM
jgi:hypothetical protein